MKNISTMFSIGNIEIKWYSFFLLVSFSLGALIIYLNKKRINLSKTEIGDMLFNLVIIAIFGARIYYVIFNLDYYLEYPLDIIKVWEGGLAIHGGIIAGLIYLFYFCKKKGISIITDIVVFALSLGQAIGRWGNFFNQEAHGGPTDLPWGIMVDGVKVHPTFLYESIWDFGVFVFLLLFRKKQKYEGQILVNYIILYSIGRFFIEGLRTDSLMLGPLKMAQVISLACIVVGVILNYILSRKAKNNI